MRNQTKSNRGGVRPGSGRPSKWRSGPTVAIRVPAAFADEILQVAKILDKGSEASRRLLSLIGMSKFLPY